MLLYFNIATKMKYRFAVGIKVMKDVAVVSSNISQTQSWYALI